MRASFTRKKLISRVLPGVELVFTSFFRFTRVLIRLDLPTLERPAKANSGNSAAGNCDGRTALVTNSTDLISILAPRQCHAARIHRSWVDPPVSLLTARSEDPQSPEP